MFVSVACNNIDQIKQLSLTNFQITDTKIHKGVKKRNLNTAAIDEENYLNEDNDLEYEELQKNLLRFVL